MELLEAMNSFISNFKKLPIAFIFGILLFIGAQFSVERSMPFWNLCYLYSLPLDDDNLRLEYQLRKAESEKQMKKILLIGSSQVREGFDANALNSATKKANISFYNLGLSGGAPSVDMFMIKDRFFSLDPELIVYMPFVESFFYNYEFSKLKFYFNPSLIKETISNLKMTNTEIHRRALIDSYLSTFSILYKYRSSIKAVFDRKLVYSLAGVDKQQPTKYAHSKNKPDSYFVHGILNSKGNRYNATKYTKGNKKLFKEFAKETLSRDIKFIVITGPTHPLIKKTYSKEIDQKYNDFLSQTAQGLGFIYIGENNLPEFTAKDFRDFTHLNEIGRKKLTSFLFSLLTKKVK